MTAKKTRDHCAIAADYAARVLDGSQLACKWVKLACQRQRDDLKRWKEGGPFRLSFRMGPGGGIKGVSVYRTPDPYERGTRRTAHQARAVVGVHPDDGIRLEAQRGRRPEVSARLH